MPSIDYIFQSALVTLVTEQAAPSKVETDNGSNTATDSPFTPAEEKFLGKFDAYGTTHLGIIYSPSDIGVREFIGRSGSDLNITPGTLLQLIRKKVIKIVPYTGFGRNTDYTIELQLSLNDVAGLGAEDKKEIEAGSAATGAAGATAEELPPPPGPEVAWVVKYGDILKESANITKKLISETKKNTKTEIYTDKSRVLKRFPKQFIRQLERLIDSIAKTSKTKFEKERLIADILDNLQINLDLDNKHIQKSYEFFKTQKRLQKELEKNK
jgi:hypothetical protein